MNDKSAEIIAIDRFCDALNAGATMNDLLDEILVAWRAFRIAEAAENNACNAPERFSDDPDIQLPASQRRAEAGWAMKDARRHAFWLLDEAISSMAE